MSIAESGQDIQLSGKSGETYTGRIYSDKHSTSTLSGQAIVCLTNSHFSDEKWSHHVNSIYNTNDVNNALEHFKLRDDISHIILIPQQSVAFSRADHVDDLIRNYLHS
ncbi:MAG TPA: hypothetical protein VF609_09880 [Flavisolibacter sp.]|jgi:hypothetical protein